MMWAPLKYSQISHCRYAYESLHMFSHDYHLFRSTLNFTGGTSPAWNRGVALKCCSFGSQNSYEPSKPLKMSVVCKLSM